MVNIKSMIKLTHFFSLILVAGCSTSPNLEIPSIEESNKETPTKITQNLTDTNCVFITNNGSDCWTRVRSYPLDIAAESFSCNLREKGIKTITIAKYIGDNGAFPNETAFILWIENDKEYLKEYYTYGNTDVFEENVRVLNWSKIRHLAESLKIDTVKSNPQLEINFSHNIGFAIQYSSNSQYFCGRLQDHQWQAAIDKKHPKVVFWKAFSDLLNPTVER
jgi:hypothetical protein